MEFTCLGPARKLRGNKVDERSSIEKYEALEQAKLSVIEGEGLRELLKDLPRAILPHSYKNLQQLLIDHKAEEFKQRLFTLFMAEWDEKARKNAKK